MLRQAGRLLAKGISLNGLPELEPVLPTVYEFLVFQRARSLGITFLPEHITIDRANRFFALKSVIEEEYTKGTKNGK